MKSSFLSLLPLMALCVGGTAHAGEKVSGKIFDLKTSPTSPRFLYESERENGENGKVEVNTRYTDLDGKVLVEEKTIYQNGNLQFFSSHQKQVEEIGIVEIKDGKIHYTFTARGKTERESDDAEENMIVPDRIGETIRKSWKELMEGETIKVRFLLPERQESIGFKFFKDEERDYKGQVAVDFVMKPSSIFIAAIAPSFRITVEKNSPHRILETEERLPIRVAQKENPTSRKDYKAIDALLVLEHLETTTAKAIEPAAAVPAQTH